MDLATATPVEIDTVIAEIYVRWYRARYEIAVQQRYLDDYQHTLDQVEASTYRYGGVPNILREYPGRIERLAAKISAMKEAAGAIFAETIPLNAEWVRRGCWSRFYLVDNGSGHVHSSMDCSTTYPTTEWVWLPEYSDQDEAGVVALAQSQACTVCFPSAPVTRNKGSIMSPAKRKSAQEREEAKQTRAAAKAAKGILTPEGDALRVFSYHMDERQIVDRQGNVVNVIPASDRYETLETLYSAKAWLTNSQEVWRGGYRPDDVKAVAAAIAHKLGTSAEVEIQAAAKRAAKRG